jgi:hypothetical protein
MVSRLEEVEDIGASVRLTGKTYGGGDTMISDVRATIAPMRRRKGL